MSRELLGVDVGGSSIKIGRVRVDDGTVSGTLESLPTPQPATPAAVLEAILAHPLARATTGPIGLAFPAVVKGGRARTAANVDRAWLGVDAAAEIERRSGRGCVFLNDADAAGLAEMRRGAGRGLGGVVLMLTLGTGIGSAPFVEGHLMPNTELGHLIVAGLGDIEAEAWASARVRSALGLQWPDWAARLDRVLAEYHRLLWPDTFIVGGAISEDFAEWGPLLRPPAPVRPAALGARAGVVGAALAAHERYNL